MYRDRFEFHRLGSEERKKVLETLLQEVLKSVDGVLLIIAFGSFVSAPAFRDIDLGLYLEHEPRDCLESEWGISDELSKVVNYIVDVKVLNCAPPDVRYSILRKGILLYERYRGLAERLAIASKKEAMDIEYKRCLTQSKFSNYKHYL